MSREEFDKKSAIIEGLWKELLDDGHSVTLVVGKSFTVSTFDKFKSLLNATKKAFLMMLKCKEVTQYAGAIKFTKEHPINVIFKYEKN